MKMIIVSFNMLKPSLMLFFSSRPSATSSLFNGTIFKTSLLAGSIFFAGINESVQAKPKSIVAVEPLVCDLVSVIALPSSPVTCLIDRKKDVHDLKISPKQAQALNNATQVFTLGQEMTPAMKKWKNNPITVVVGVSAIEIDDHDDHDDHSAAKHDDHDDHSSAKHDDHDDHGDEAFEWAGVFELSRGTYKWSFAKVDGDYADPVMKMVILKTGDIEASEELAEELLESKNSEVKRKIQTLKEIMANLLHRTKHMFLHLMREKTAQHSM